MDHGVDLSTPLIHRGLYLLLHHVEVSAKDPGQSILPVGLEDIELKPDCPSCHPPRLPLPLLDVQHPVVAHSHSDHHHVV